MVARLNDFPNFCCNVNVVPSLLMQLDECQQLNVDDSFLRLAKKPAPELEPADQAFLLEHFFSLHWDHMVKPHPRYRDLLQMRGAAAKGEGVWDIAQFCDADYRDLQLWFYLAWSGESLRRDPVTLRLLSKERNFSEADKEELFEVQRLFIAKIMPLYQQLHVNQRIELSCSPLYHPILPLLCDTRLARVTRPDLSLPELLFRHPEDAEYQLREALRYMAARLGISPRGVWPSEGALSPQVLTQMIDSGVQWTASDELVLYNSLDDRRGDTHFFPYRFVKENGAISIFFRDRALSDLIGFTYSQWPSKDAAENLMARLAAIAREVDEEAVISIILDGENAWEYYPENGRVFWETVFSLLDGQTEIQPITFSNYLARHPAQLELKSLCPGSWIDGNFKLWIGHPEKNRAWELLAEARAAVAVRTCSETDRDVWEHIYIAEGSDWFWWYGDDHYSSYREEFDVLFRKHLQYAYESIGLAVPPLLLQPILERKAYHAVEPPVAEITPTLDGKVTDYFEWLGAGRISSAATATTMHPVGSILSQIMFGFNQKYLFLRLDLLDTTVIPGESQWKFEISFQRPSPVRVEIAIGASAFSAWLVCGEHRKQLPSVARGKIVELAVPLETLCGTPGEEICWFIQIWRDGQPVERWPRTEVFSLAVEINRDRFEWRV